MAKELAIDAVMGQGVSLIDFYRNNPCIAAYDLLGVDLAPIQRLVFEDMWFKDYTLLVATRGLGKCIATDSIVLTINGLTRLCDILPSVPNDLENGKDIVVDYIEPLYTYNGFRNTSKVSLGKNIIGKAITTEHGFELQGSNQHSILTLNKDRSLVYKRLDELMLDDLVCIQKDQNIYGCIDISPSEAYSEGASIITNGVTTSPELNISKDILNGTKETQLHFLNGLYKTNGIVYKNYTFLKSKSKKLIKELQLIMLNMGIISNTYVDSDGIDTIELYSSVERYMFDSDEGHNLSFFFDKVVYKSEWTGNCYDFCMNMDEEPNYFSNGFISHNTFLLGTLAALRAMLYPGTRIGLLSASFRQSRMIFNEVERLWNKSSIFQECVSKRPIKASDSNYLVFKSIGGVNGSYIEALPIGDDGSKIRGSRFHIIEVDEYAQVPKKIIDLVIRPFSATTNDPMANVRRLEKQKLLIENGLATEDDFEAPTVNKMIMTSSGYFKFNHMYTSMKDHWSQVDKYEEKSRYAIWQVPYWDLPEGFLDKANIEEAKRVMSSHEFRMEYEAAMISDSEGFFKASLIASCCDNSGFTLELRGDPTAEYVLGIDPNQAGSASCGVIIVKLGKVNRIVRAIELKKMTTQEMTTSVQDLCTAYNIIRIFMDKGGGGKPICDLLEEGYNGYEPIIDRTNPDHTNKQGNHILEMINFSPAWISDANFATLALLESKSLLFPEPSEISIDANTYAYDTINVLKSQLTNIVVTQTKSGILHFDTPAKSQNKDLYSALILASYGIKELSKEATMDSAPMLHSVSGMHENHNGSSWKARGIVKGTPLMSKSDSVHSKAILRKPIK